MEGIKSDMLDFQLKFFTSDPYLNDVESNWNNLKQAINNTIITHISQNPSQSGNNLPWITPSIKRLMYHQTCLYRKAKSLQTENAWNDYHILRNKVTNCIRNAHTNYQTNLFNKNEKSNHKTFWKYVKNICKDQHGIPPLNDNGNTVNSSQEKANNYSK